MPIALLVLALLIGGFGWVFIDLERVGDAVMSTAYIDLDLHTREGQREADRITRRIRAEEARSRRKKIVLASIAAVLGLASAAILVRRLYGTPTNPGRADGS